MKGLKNEENKIKISICGLNGNETILNTTKLG